MRPVQRLRLTLLLATALLALAPLSGAAEGSRYIVVTKTPVRAGSGRPASSMADAVERGQRHVARFRTMSGFAADLTPRELAALRASGDVRWIEPVVPRHAFGLERNLHGQTRPYGITAVQAPGVWAATRSDVVNVAILDTGVTPDHPDLQGLVAGGYSVFGASWDDYNGHGTHVAGTIAALDNEVGVVGVAPGVRLWSVRVLNSTGAGTSDGVLQGLDWVVDKKREIGGRWVANLSLGDGQSSAAEHEAFRLAAAEGILIVAATGNSSEPGAPAPVAYPAAYPEVVAVGATDVLGAIAEFSNQGPEVDLVAPGVSVLSTAPLGEGVSTYIIDDLEFYDARAVDGSPNGVITGAYVFCGLGRPEEFPAAVEGKIALIERGELLFAEKARNAKQAGASAVVIYNNVEGGRSTWTLVPKGDPDAANYPWPVTLSLSKEDGERLRGRASGAITLQHSPDDYTYKSGTSMSAPHVAGAAALLWSIVPGATPEEILAALLGTASDLGAEGPDQVFGAGLLNVYGAAQHLAPSALPRTGRTVLRRGRG